MLGFLDEALPSWLVVHGSIWASDDADLRRVPTLVPLGKVAVDIGANAGLYTAQLLRGSRQVHAFEPNPALAARLARMLPMVSVHAFALSNHDGEAILRTPQVGGVTLNGWATIEPRNDLAALPDHVCIQLSVPTRKLDSFALNDVGIIKLDVEGHELAVLQGGFETIRRCRPVLFFEAGHVFESLESITTLLEPLGYRVFPSGSGVMFIAVIDGLHFVRETGT